MTTKDVIWTIVISVFVTVYVTWRLSMLIGEEQAINPPEDGFAAERREQDAVNARQSPTP